LIIKYDSNGNVLWYRKIIGATTVQSNCIIGTIKTDGANNVYAYCNFYGIIYVDGQVFTSSGAHDILFIKYDKYGNLLWAKKAGGQLDDRIAFDGFKVNKNGTIFCTGNYASDNNVSFTYDTTAVIINDTTGTHSFIASINANGNIKWFKRTTVINASNTIDFLTLDKNSNVYISGIAEIGCLLDSMPLQVYPNLGQTKIFF